MEQHINKLYSISKGFEVYQESRTPDQTKPLNYNQILSHVADHNYVVMVNSTDDITILFQAESTVVVAPYMNKLTKSEIHAIMTGGFATVAGSYMAVLIQVGVSTFTRFSFG